MARLQAMYQRLPPDKQKAARVHMQARINELQDAINGKVKVKPRSGMSLMQTVIVVLLASLVAVALGFFGVTFMAKS
ncbi:MAG: hypothetical protein VR70_12375 [Rhodospirillaceae bacterium BRH_c57]|nr:MAG: hypothetical protein VR70_12375 [Rhodospirillaceae bacterium BRH_c57]